MGKKKPPQDQLNTERAIVECLEVLNMVCTGPTDSRLMEQLIDKHVHRDKLIIHVPGAMRIRLEVQLFLRSLLELSRIECAKRALQQLDDDLMNGSDEDYLEP